MNIIIDYIISESLQILVQHGSDLSLPDNEGNYPVFLAATEENLKIVNLLFESGADLSA